MSNGAVQERLQRVLGHVVDTTRRASGTLPQHCSGASPKRYETVEVEIHSGDGFGIIRFNRPKSLNAFSTAVRLWAMDPFVVLVHGIDAGSSSSHIAL